MGYAVRTDGQGWRAINSQSDLLAGETYSDTQPGPAPSTEQDYANAVQTFVDQTAQAGSYVDGVTCASYLNSTNASWSADAKAFIAWRDTVWDGAYATLAAVQADTMAQPTVAHLVSGLPAITWPSTQ